MGVKTGWFAVTVVLLGVSATGCDRLKGLATKGESAEAGATQGSTSSGTAMAGGARTAPKDDDNLLSIAAGAVVIERIPQDDSSWDHDAHQLLDDNAESFDQHEKAGAHSMVIAIPHRATFKRFTFRGVAKKVVVEVSDDPLGKKGFQKVAEAKLNAENAAQTLVATKETPSRTVKVTYENAEENDRNTDFRGYGTKLDDPGWGTKNLTGNYRHVNGNDLDIRQSGALVRGCWGTDTFHGIVDGPIVKVQFRHADGTDSGPGILNLFGTRAYLMYYRTPEDISFFQGERENAKPSPEACEGLLEEKKVAAAPDPIAADIEKFGRTRIYGIRFDTDADVIKPESKPVLDRVVAVMKAKPDWKLTVEGHTDDTATPAYNQTLSEKRAKAVKKWLEGQGIAGARLKPVGLGQTKPVASNASSIGRAENRRVELAKQ